MKQSQDAMPGSQQQVVQARRIAWSTKSASNGLIYQWSRWHLTHTLVRGEKTLCGETLPFAKWITPQPGDERGDYRIKGGECQQCKRLNAEVRNAGPDATTTPAAKPAFPALNG